jgi:excinuclease UvrABC nuclease subunit
VPFPNQVPTLYTRANIEALAPNQSGCYGIFKSGEWIYVGKGDIRQRLLDHFNGDNYCIVSKVPTHLVTAVSAVPDALEKSLITELRPSCNQRVG